MSPSRAPLRGLEKGGFMGSLEALGGWGSFLGDLSTYIIQSTLTYQNLLFLQGPYFCHIRLQKKVSFGN